MSFLKNLFGGSDKHPLPDDNPIPTRVMQLPFTASADNGHLFAKLFVDLVKKNERVRLDYSVETIDFVNKFLQRSRDEGLSVNDFAETIFVVGSYVGQVMVNNNSGLWIASDEARLPEGVTMMPIVVKLPNGTIADPIAKAYKRFHFGESDDLVYFYQVFTSEKGQ
jgi:hypothetical protein